MYEFLSKRRPFEEKNKSDLKANILNVQIMRVAKCQNDFLERTIISYLQKEERITSTALRNLERIKNAYKLYWNEK